MLHRLNDHDGVVNYETDRQHQTEKREGVNRETEQWEDHERTDQRHGHGEQRDQRRSPTLQEEIDHEGHENDRGDERFDNFLYPLRNRERGIDRDLVIEVGWEACLQFL